MRVSPSTPRQLVKQMRSGDVDLWNRKAVLIGSREASVAIEGLRVAKSVSCCERGDGPSKNEPLRAMYAAWSVRSGPRGVVVALARYGSYMESQHSAFPVRSACLLAAGIRRSTCSAAEASTLSATPGAAALALP